MVDGSVAAGDTGLLLVEPCVAAAGSLSTAARVVSVQAGLDDREAELAEQLAKLAGLRDDSRRPRPPGRL